MNLTVESAVWVGWFALCAFSWWLPIWREMLRRDGADGEGLGGFVCVESTFLVVAILGRMIPTIALAAYFVAHSGWAVAGLLAFGAFLTVLAGVMVVHAGILAILLARATRNPAARHYWARAWALLSGWIPRHHGSNLAWTVNPISGRPASRTLLRQNHGYVPAGAWESGLRDWPRHEIRYVAEDMKGAPDQVWWALATHRDRLMREATALNPACPPAAAVAAALLDRSDKS